MKKCFAFLYFFLLLNAAQAQHLYTHAFSLEDGLKAIETYQMDIAPDGKLWFQSGSKYIGIYDGIDFEFISCDSLGILGYFNSMEFYDSTLWLLSSTGNSISIKGDNIRKFEGVGGAGVFAVGDDVYFASSISRDFFKYNQKTNDTIPLFPDPFFDGDSLKNREKYFFSPVEPYSRFKSFFPDIEKYLLKDGVWQAIYSNQKTRIFKKTENGISFVSKDGLLISANAKNIRLEKFIDINTLETTVLHDLNSEGSYHLFADGENSEYLIANTKGSSKFTLYIIGKEKLEPKGQLDIENLLDLKVDQNEKVWAAGHDGLYRIDPYLLQFSSSDENMIGSLHGIAEDAQGNIWFAGYKSGLAKYNGNELVRLPADPNLPLQQFLPGPFSEDGNMYFFIGDNYQLLQIKNGVRSYHRLFTTPGQNQGYSGYYIRRLRDGRMAFGMNKVGLGIADDISKEEIMVKAIGKDKGLLLDNVLTFSEDEEGRIWCGRSSQGVGLYLPERDTAFTWLISAEQPKSFGAMSSKIDLHGNLWLGTNKGLYFLKDPHLFDPSEDLFSVAIPVHFPDNDQSTVTSIEQVSDYLVAGNNTGVHFINLDSFYFSKNGPLIYSLFYGKDIDGSGTEQNSFFVDSKGYLWIGSQISVTRMDIENYPFDNSPVDIQIKDVVAGQSSFAYNGGDIIIPIDNRNFSLKIRPRTNPSFQNHIFYNYHLVNTKGDTLISGYNVNQPDIRMSYVPAGKYIFHIEAFKNGRKVDEVNTILRAPRSLSENPLFWLGLGGIAVAAMGIFVYFRNRAKRQLLQNELALSRMKNDKDHLQIQAIISSFNPHFINNSLHWVQSRYKQDPEMVTLIGRLSKNIQYIFNNTRKGKAFHNLSEEIELVKNYITIQQIRFEGSFRFEMPEESEISKLARFPILLMQLQIHIENAVEHGLRNRIESSFVRLALEEEADYIHFKITDDGSGRPKARELSSSGTQNGTSMLRELHEIFNANNSKPILTTYIDEPFVGEKSDERFGTTVIISIPKNYHYELEKT